METVLRFLNFLFNKFMETMRKMRGERNKIQGKYGENKGSKKKWREIQIKPRCERNKKKLPGGTARMSPVPPPVLPLHPSSADSAPARAHRSYLGPYQLNPRQ